MSFASERYRLAAEQASTVSRALPYLRRYAGATMRSPLASGGISRR